jgi:hypothetical protein
MLIITLRITPASHLWERGGNVHDMVTIPSETNEKLPSLAYASKQEWWSWSWVKQIKNNPHLHLQVSRGDCCDTGDDPSSCLRVRGVMVMTWQLSQGKNAKNHPHLMFVSKRGWWLWCGSHCKQNKPRTTPTLHLWVRGGGGCEWISDVALRGRFSGAYLMVVPLYWSPSTPARPPKPNWNPSHPIWMGGGVVWVGCTALVPVVTSSINSKNEKDYS